MNKISPDPRLPSPPNDFFLKQLVTRLYELLSAIISRVNSLIGGQLMVVTTTEKNALPATAGMMVFDSTLGKACIYTGSAWQTITSS